LYDVVNRVRPRENSHTSACRTDLFIQSAVNISNLMRAQTTQPGSVAGGHCLSVCPPAATRLLATDPADGAPRCIRCSRLGEATACRKRVSRRSAARHGLDLDGCPLALLRALQKYVDSPPCTVRPAGQISRACRRDVVHHHDRVFHGGLTRRQMSDRYSSALRPPSRVPGRPRVHVYSLRVYSLQPRLCGQLRRRPTWPTWPPWPTTSRLRSCCAPCHRRGPSRPGPRRRSPSRCRGPPCPRSSR